MTPGIHALPSADYHAERIPLPARGGGVRAHAIVDAADFEWLSHFRWFLGSDGYARRFEAIPGTARRRGIAMHRQLLNLGPGNPLEGDHINGDRLDNRRANLRAVTRAQNNQNVRRVGRSGHRNVSLHAASGLWRVQLHAEGKPLSGGYFRRQEDAVAAAVALRRKHLPFAVEAS